MTCIAEKRHLHIGVLALQGAFREHVEHIERLGHQPVEVRSVKALSEIDGLIIPGGESTTMGKLLNDFEMLVPLKERISSGLPVWGTCAGLILLAKNIENDSTVHLTAMDVTAVRNAYGRQLGSFKTSTSIGNVISDFPAVFIRAPYISKCDNSVEVLSLVDDKIVCARQDNMLVTAFHPELTDDTRMLEFFIDTFINKN